MTALSDLVCLIKIIPASFWGVIVGSFFSIGGVALTNRAIDRRLQAQFEHERLRKKKDREMELRKEVYLAAAEAISAGLNAVGRFANLDLPNDQVTNDYTERSPAIAKVHVIAKTETVEALVRFTNALGVLFLKQFSRRIELMIEKNSITILDNQIVDFGKERDRFLEMIKQHNIEGVVDGRRWNVLQENFEFEQKRIRDGTASRAKLLEALQPKQFAFARECVSNAAELGQLLIPILVAIRAELELEFDEEAYRQMISVSIVKQQEAFDGFVHRLTPNAQSYDPRDASQVARPLNS